MISSFEDVGQYLAQASEAAQRFLACKDMRDFERAVGFLLPILSSPYKIPTAAFGIGLLCQEKAKDLLAQPEPDQGTADQFFEKAAKYYLIAAAMPDDGDFGSSRAKVSLATLYEDCLVPIKAGLDREKVAFSLILEAANADFAEAQMSAANRYYAGRGVEQSYSLSLYWMKQAQKNKGQLSPELQAEVEGAILIIENDLRTAAKLVSAEKQGRHDSGRLTL